MKQEKAHNSRFLGALGFLGFLGSLGFVGTKYDFMAKCSFLAFLSLFSMLVLIPFPKDKVKYPAERSRLPFLSALAFLSFLSALFGKNPLMAQFAIFACAALYAAPQKKKKDVV